MMMWAVVAVAFAAANFDGDDAELHRAMRGTMARVERCEFRMRAGLWDGSRVVEAGPALELTFGANRTVVVVEPHTPEIGGMLLCTHGSGSPTLLMVANDLKFLWRLWTFFAHKVAWATSVGIRAAIWIGELPNELATTAGRACLRSLEIGREWRRYASRRTFYVANGRPLHSNHHIKMLAAYGALDSGPVFYLDMEFEILDWTNGSTVVVPRLASLTPADVVFVPNRVSPFWHVKGRAFYARGELGKLFVAKWLAHRCGFKDQFSLWHTILDLAGSRGCLDYQNQIFDNRTYHDLKHFTALLVQHPALNATCADRVSACPDFGFCDDDVDVETGLFHHSLALNANRTLAYAANGSIHTLVLADRHPRHVDNNSVLLDFHLDHLTGFW